MPRVIIYPDQLIMSPFSIAGTITHMTRPLLSTHPVFYMIISVIAFSVLPILLKFGNASESPLMFTGVIYLGSAIAMMSMSAPFRGKLDILHPAINCVRRNPFLVLISMCAAIGAYALLSLSLAFVSVSVSGVLYETWPMFLLVLTLYLDRNTGRYNVFSISTCFLFFQSLAGMTLIVMSHNTSNAHSASFTITDSGTLFGVFLVLSSALCAAVFATFTLKLGCEVAARNTDRKNREKGEIFYAIVVTSTTHLCAGSSVCALSFLLGETLTWNQFFWAAMAGFCVNSIGTIAFRLANLKTRNLGVNAIAYATPLFTLGWLWLLSMIDVPRVDYLIIGALGVVSANLLVNAAPNIHSDYKGLVIVLWVSGTITYLLGEPATLSVLVQVTISCAAFLVLRTLDAGRTRATLGHGDGTRRLALVSSGLIVAGFTWLFCLT